jgi:multicomponent Na+:H+ antiporter subunit E
VALVNSGPSVSRVGGLQRRVMRAVIGAMGDEFRSDLPLAARLGRVANLSMWLFGVWVLLTWSPFTLEQELFGAGFAVTVAVVVAPFGGVIPPWRLLNPRRLLAIGRLLVETLLRINRANLELAYRIWAPSRPISSGMVIVPTHQRSPGGLTAVGLISSLIVDNQIVDLDRRSHHLQYHAVSVPEGGPRRRRDAINRPIEAMLEPLVGDER